MLISLRYYLYIAASRIYLQIGGNNLFFVIFHEIFNKSEKKIKISYLMFKSFSHHISTSKTPIPIFMNSFINFSFNFPDFFTKEAV